MASKKATGKKGNIGRWVEGRDRLGRGRIQGGGGRGI